MTEVNQMGLRIEYLHCNECRLPSTPSGRRVLEYPDATGASVTRICEPVARWRRLSVAESALQRTSIASKPLTGIADD